ncbi:MAG: helix-turn-helix transcriptional regulator [Methanobrevibacter sp.]|nr:helix-turn-helix transcriptional regulator [Methanobrevibacter sp.]
MYKYHKIRDLREDNDYTQSYCAERLYVSKNSYIRYENGERIPPIDFMERVADLYNVTLDYLCDRDK